VFTEPFTKHIDAHNAVELACSKILNTSLHPCEGMTPGF